MRPDKKLIWTFAAAAAALGAAVALIMYPNPILSCLGRFFSACSFLIVGICLAYVLNIPMRAVERRLFGSMSSSQSRKKRRLARTLSLVITIAAVAGILVLSVAVVIPGLADAVRSLASDAGSYAEKLRTAAENSQGGWKNIIDGMYSLAAENADTVRSWITNKGAGAFSAAASAALGAFGGIKDFVLGFVVSIYILADKEHLIAGLRKSLAAMLSDNARGKLYYIARHADSSFSGFITGQLTEAVILGGLCFVGMLILRIPYAGIVSFIIGIASLIPVVGALCGGAVSAFIILMSSPVKAVIFVIFLLCLQLVEGNLIYPKVVGGSVGLPGLLVLSAVMIGGSLGGIAGVLFGVPLCSLLYTLYKDFIDNRIHRRSEKRSGQ